MKDNKKQATERMKQINAKKEERKNAKIDSRKVHDTKGKNVHGRTYR